MGEVFKLNHCYNVDCVPAMELFPDNYFDLAVVDPPYFSGPERRGFYGSKVSKIGVHRDYPISPAWIRPGPEYFRELLRVSRHYIVWGCNYFDYKFATGRIVWDNGLFDPQANATRAEAVTVLDNAVARLVQDDASGDVKGNALVNTGGVSFSNAVVSGWLYLSQSLLHLLLI